MWEWGAHVSAEQSPEERVIFWTWGYNEPPRGYKEPHSGPLREQYVLSITGISR